MFDLPDLPIPLANNAPANTQSPAAGTETPAGTSSSAPTQLVVPLPPILDIGFTKNALPTLGKGTVPEATQPKEDKQPAFTRLIDASRFDIAGIGLGMTPEEAEEAAKEYNFTLVDTIYNIRSNNVRSRTTNQIVCAVSMTNIRNYCDSFQLFCCSKRL